MYKLLATFVFISLLVSSSYACVINAPSTIVTSSKELKSSIQNLIHFNQCGQEEISLFYQIAAKHQKKLNQKEVLKKYRLYLSNDINLLNYDEFLSSRLKLTKGNHIKKSSLLGTNLKAFSIDKHDHIEIECHNCDSLGKKNFKLSIMNPKGHQRHHWFETTVVKKIKVLETTQTQRYTNRSINISALKWKEIETHQPEKYITSLENLAYFKPNKTIQIGKTLMGHHITPINLVSPRIPATIKVHHGALKIKSKAIPTRRGKLGDIITLKNIKNNKIIIGKVIGENLIEVNL